MRVRSLIAVAALAMVLAPFGRAVAADLAGPPIPPPVVVVPCSPPPSAVQAQSLAPNFLAWFGRADNPRIFFAERFDPRVPPPAVVPKYVVPQTAYLASSFCDLPYGTTPRSWYDGKVFYAPGGNMAAPDAFMVIERR